MGVNITKVPDILDLDVIIEQLVIEENMVCPICGTKSNCNGYERSSTGYGNIKNHKGPGYVIRETFIYSSDCTFINKRGAIVPYASFSSKSIFNHDTRYYWKYLDCKCETCGATWYSNLYPEGISAEIKRTLTPDEQYTIYKSIIDSGLDIKRLMEVKAARKKQLESDNKSNLFNTDTNNSISSKFVEYLSPPRNLTEELRVSPNGIYYCTDNISCDVEITYKSIESGKKKLKFEGVKLYVMTLSNDKVTFLGVIQDLITVNFKMIDSIKSIVVTNMQYSVAKRRIIDNSDNNTNLHKTDLTKKYARIPTIHDIEKLNKELIRHLSLSDAFWTSSYKMNQGTASYADDTIYIVDKDGYILSSKASIWNTYCIAIWLETNIYNEDEDCEDNSEEYYSPEYTYNTDTFAALPDKYKDIINKSLTLENRPCASEPLKLEEKPEVNSTNNSEENTDDNIIDVPASELIEVEEITNLNDQLDQNN